MKGIFTRKQNSILSAAFIIMVTFGLSHVMGLVKTRLLITYFFGSARALLDVYYASFALPDTIFQLLVVGSLSSAFIPVFTKYLARDEKTAWDMANSTLLLVVTVFFAISVIMFIFAPVLAPLLGPGFDPAQISLLISLLRIMLVAQAFFTISGFLTAMLQSHQHFLVPALAPIMYNLGIILGTVLLSPTLGILGPGIGAVFGAAMHMLIQLPLATSLGFKPGFKIHLSSPVKEVMRLMPPRALALGIDQIELLAAVIIASTLAPGSLSILTHAKLLYMIPASLFGVTIGQAALPSLSRQSAENDRKLFSDTFTTSVLQVIFLALPISILLIVLRIPIVRIIFGAKSLPWIATVLTGRTLAILTLSATAIAAMQLITRSFFALHDTKTPLIVGSAAAVAGILTSLLMTRVLGFGVLGLATSVTIIALCESLTLFTLLCSRLKLPLKRTAIPVIKMLTTAGITGICLYIPMKLLDQFVFDTTRTIPLIALTGITTVIGMSMYILLSYFFRVDEFYTFLGLAKKLSNLKNLINLPKNSAASAPPTVQN